MQDQGQIVNPTQGNKNTINGNGVPNKEERVQNMYHRVLQRFRYTMKQGPPEWRERLLFLDRQTNFVNQLVELIKAVKRESGTRQKKIERSTHGKKKSATEETKEANQK